MTGDPLWPLFDRFPSLAGLPRVALRRTVTPVEPLGQISRRLWVKRDDLTADPIGGNKVRGLELHLAAFPRRVITGGARGSTHVLSTVAHARRLGIDVEAIAWPQEMNDVARAVDARLESEISRRHFGNPVAAAIWLTWCAWQGDPILPAGGTTPSSVLAHANAALELVAQIDAGVVPKPTRVVVPLGTGGTAAGLALGFALAETDIGVIGARVVPRVIGRAGRVRRLARRGAALISRLTGARVNGDVNFDVDDRAYGGAYGRPLAASIALANRLPTTIGVDPTYSAKALVVAARSAETANTVFWLTFDSRWIASRSGGGT